MGKPSLIVQGMHGLGDNLHQRAIIRQLMVSHDVWLETSWAAPYHDLIEQGLKVMAKPSSLRTQAKNAVRERAKFYRGLPPRCKAIKIWYTNADYRERQSVLGAMFKTIPFPISFADQDFRLPVPAEWIAELNQKIASQSKPIMIYRPLIDRKEWGGCNARNPNHMDYFRLFKSIRDQYYVISIADLVPNVEWIVGSSIEPDLAFHKGELNFEMLAALFRRATLVYCSPGFAVVLAQAVETSVACIFGGYERAYSFSPGAKFAPYLGIEPIITKDDFRHDPGHDKTIDYQSAAQRIEDFSALAIAARHTNQHRGATPELGTSAT